MRFAALKLARYGRFQDCDLLFKSSDIDLQLILGPNEAGKSTTRAAVSDLLFGFKDRTRFAFRFDQTALRVGAVVEAGGSSLEIRRKKGRLNTLLTPDDETADQNLLVPYLAGQTRETFERMFSLDHERLREGGKLMLDNKNDIGAALFAAGSGLTHVVQACEELEKEAKAIWGKTAGEGRPLNKAFSDYQQGRQTLKEVEVRPAAWSKAKRHLEQLGRELDALKAERAELNRRQRLVQRQQLVLGPLATRERANRRLVELGSVPELPADTAARLGDVLETAQRAKVEIALACEEVARLQADLASDQPSAPLLAIAAEVDGLRELKGIVDHAAASLPGLMAELEVVKARVRSSAAELGRPDRSTEALGGSLPDLPTLEEISGLVERWSGIEEQLRSGREAEADAKANLEKIREQVSALPPAPDVGPLQDLLRTYRPAGLTAVREEAERARDELQKHRDAAIRKLAPWSGDLSTLRALPLPAIDDVESALASMDVAQDELKAASEAYDRELATSEQLELERRQAVQTHPTPMLSALEAARRSRLALWAPIRCHVLGEEPLVEPGGKIEAFETAVAESDRIADERFAGAEHAGALAVLERDIEKAALKAVQAQRRREQARERVTACQKAFDDLIAGCGAALSAATYTNWYDDRLDVLAKADAADLADAAVSRARSAEASACDELRTALGHADRSEASLGVLLTEVERAVEEASEARARLRELQAKFEGAEDNSAAAARQVTRAAQAHSEWLVAWTAALKAAGLPEDLGVPAARAMVDNIDDLRTDLRLLIDKQAALDAAQRSITDFEKRVTEAVKQSGLSPIDGVMGQYAALQTQVSEVRRQADRAEELTGNLEQATAKKVAREEALAAAEALLEPLLQFATGTDATEIRAVLARAQEAAQLREDIARCVAEILGHGEGRSLESLIEEASTVDADTLADDAVRIAEELDELAPQIDAKSEERSAADVTFKSLNDGPDAAIASFAIAEARSEMAFQSEQYIRKRAEARILRTVIERYRQLKQGPLLARASGLFATLTLGAFTRLAVDYDDDVPNLKGVRSEDVPYVGLDGMSEGTIDQLYLALRIAAVEEMINQGTRLPFLADDLFINFDEERAAAGFKVLGELARKTQVLFFTHHAHLARVADDALKPASIFVCGLDRDVPPSLLFEVVTAA